MLVALLGMSIVGCGNTATSTSTPATSSTAAPSSSVVDPAQEAIKAILSRIVLVKDKQEVMDDFEVPSKVIYEGTEYAISWTSEDDRVTFETVEGTTWARLTRPKKGEEKVTVKPEGFPFRLLFFVCVSKPSLRGSFL